MIIKKILEKWDIILDIAIIGSGMAGLAAARILKAVKFLFL